MKGYFFKSYNFSSCPLKNIVEQHFFTYCMGFRSGLAHFRPYQHHEVKENLSQEEV